MEKKILLVEDDYLDVISVQRALTKLNVQHKLFVVHNGVDALDLLNGTDHKEKIIPDIIILDINMPKMNGLEFLRVIKNYYTLNNIRVFVMTTSSEEYEKLTAFNLGVDGYILKPLDFNNPNPSREVLDLKEALLDSGH